MAKHTFRSQWGTVTVDNGVVTVAPPLDVEGYADPRWVEEMYWLADLIGEEAISHHGEIEPGCDACQELLDGAEQKLLNRAIDDAFEAADELLNCDEVCDDPDCDACRKFVGRLRIVPKHAPRRSHK